VKRPGAGSRLTTLEATSSPVQPKKFPGKVSFPSARPFPSDRSTVVQSFPWDYVRRAYNPLYEIFLGSAAIAGAAIVHNSEALDFDYKGQFELTVGGMGVGGIAYGLNNIWSLINEYRRERAMVLPGPGAGREMNSGPFSKPHFNPFENR
jgi:hypothetical protein